MIFRPWRKTAVGSIRDNSAAWVAGPSRICFVRVSSNQPEALDRDSSLDIQSEIKSDWVRSGPVPAKAHPGFLDRPGPAHAPASVWVRGQGRVGAGAGDRLVRGDTAQSL
jgi:hypothetical protein